MRKSILLVSLLLVVAMLLAACLAQAPATEAPTEAPATEAPTEATSLDAQAAADAALAAVPGSAVVEIDRGSWRERPTWEVVVRNSNGGGTELYIDAVTADVVKQEPAEVPIYARVSAPAITADAAMDTALLDTPGTVEEVGLGREGGRTVWEVLVAGTNGLMEYYIDATTGEIIKKEPQR